MGRTVIAIRPRRLFKDGMSHEEIYDISRGIWKIKVQSFIDTKYAVVVHDGVIREVFEVEKWHPAATTLYKHPRKLTNLKGRFEFTGKVAPKSIRDSLLGKTIKFKRGDSGPVRLRVIE